MTASARFNVSVLSLEDQLGDALTGDTRSHAAEPRAGGQLPAAPGRSAATPATASRRARRRRWSSPAPARPIRAGSRTASSPTRRSRQVVARTFELGVRGRWRQERTTLDYVVAGFRTTNLDDILFISSGAVANRGYFANVGDTRRQGIEASLLGRRRLGAAGRATAGSTGRCTTPSRRATFQTPFTALSAAHPDAVDGAIDVPAGARIPGVPAHIGKAVAHLVRRRPRLRRAGRDRQQRPVLPGRRGEPAGAVARLRRRELARRVSARPPAVGLLIVSNLFDARYATFGVLGDATPVLARLHRSALHRPRRAARGLARRRRELLRRGPSDRPPAGAPLAGGGLRRHGAFLTTRARTDAGLADAGRDQLQ